MELQSMAVEMPVVKGHPNRVAFRGVLTMVDTPSNRAPQGSKGKQVILTRRAAEAAIPSLLGMAVDYAPSFGGHDARRKVGVITHAEVVGRELEVRGYLYAKDFPEVVEEVAQFGRKPVTSQPETSSFRTQRNVVAIHAARTEGARLRDCLKAAVREMRAFVERARGEARVLTSVAPSGEGSSGLGMSFEVTNVKKESEWGRIWRLTHVTFTGAAILRRERAAFADTWIELG